MFQSKCYNNDRDTLPVWAHKTSKSSHLKSERPVSSRDSERSCILGISILPLSAIFLLEFGTVSTMLYFCFFILLLTLRFTVWVFYGLNIVIPSIVFEASSIKTSNDTDIVKCIKG